MNLNSALRLAVVIVALAPLALTGCVTTVLGQRPTEHDLRNDGSPEAQAGLYRTYEVIYDQQVFRRPGAVPAVVAEELNLDVVDDVSAFAFSDDAFNYLAMSERAADIMEHPAVAFDAFAKSGQGQTVIIGTGIGSGLIAGGVAWFIRTTVRDGVTENEATDLWVSAGGGFVAGAFLGVIVSAAYTYIVPAISTPFATPLYRQAARAFNEDLDRRLAEGAPAGDAPPDDAAADNVETPAPTEQQPATPTLEPAPPAPAPATTPTAGT